MMLSLSCAALQPLIRNLDRYVALTPDDRAAIAALGDRSQVEKPAHTDIAREGERARVAHAVISGWACCYKDLPDGRRQILGFLLPGDVFDLNLDSLREQDCSVSALTRVRLAELLPSQVRALPDDHPRVWKALLLQQQANAAILREWLLNTGQRTAIERLAHLLIELFLRNRAIGLASHEGLKFPITQSHLAEATGLTPVHVNRTVQALRRQDLIEYANGHLKILDLARLSDIALFDAKYLCVEEYQ
jgi:CRP-like cAMP-binding protein